MITIEGFSQVMETITEIYPKDSPNENAQKIYFLIFKKNFETDEQLMEATLKVLETRVFTSFPKPAEFLEACKLKVDIESEITQSIIQIKETIKKIGAYENVCFDNPIIHKCIQSCFGSWVKLCKMEIKEYNELFKWDFPKIYKYYRENKLKDIPIYLEGAKTHLNSLQGIEEETTVKYIGNKVKCLQWNIAYFKKNPTEQLNNEKFIKLGFKENEILQIESNLEINSKEKLMKEIENLGITKKIGYKKTGIEYTKEEIKKLIK